LHRIYQSPISYLQTLTLITILIFATYLRWKNVGVDPGWYTDEGTHLEIARHWLNGEQRYLAIGQSTLLFAKLPLFEWLLAAAIAIFGKSMTTLRMLTGGLGVMTVGLVYLVGRDWRLEIGDSANNLQSLITNLLPVFLLAIYPNAVLYSRFGFSYNLVAVWVLLVFWGLGKYVHGGGQNWLFLASVGLGLGMLTDLWMVCLLPAFFLTIASTTLPRKPHDFFLAMTLVIAPFALFMVSMLLTAPNAFWFDMDYTLFRLGGRDLGEQFSLIIENITILFAQDRWFLLGFLGLFFIPPRKWRGLALVFFVSPLFVLGRTVALHGLSFYYLIPVLPFVAMGFGQLLFGLGQTLTHMLANFAPKQVAVGVTLLALATPFVLADGFLFQNNQWFAVAPFLLNAENAGKTADFLNAQLQPDDVTIINPTMAWMIDGNVADFQMMVAVNEVATPHMPANIPPERWLFDPSLENVDYIVVDNLWENWTRVHVAEMPALFKELQTWDLLFEAGEIRVFSRPE
jgi:4-amino-4-deoxy-L-arabinose transferase-like glycosyltransferase